MRLRKVEAILSKLGANRRDEPAIIIYADDADRDRQLAALQEKGHKGVIIELPDNHRGPEAGPGSVAEGRRLILAGTSYAEPDAGEVPAP
jgi:hypothetical protein